MKLLLLGGPRFLGRAIADAALERGHELTFFNRGTTKGSPLAELGGRPDDEVTDESYGPLKALCERVVEERFGDRALGVTWEKLLHTCRDIARANAEIIWVAPEFLVEQDVGAWMELPLWLVDPAAEYADRVDVRRAVEAGLRFRPLDETVRGALEQAETTEAAGLTPEREADLLGKWHAR